MTCVVSDTLALQTTHMEVHPFYDINHSEWVAEIDGKEVCADTLSDLKAKCPTCQIRDYYPEGYAAHRPGFLEPSSRVPFVKCFTPSKARQRKINTALQREAAVERVTAVATAVAAASITEEPKPPTYEAVMELSSLGVRTPQIAERLRVKLSDVQLLKMEGYRKHDPRIRPKYKMRSFRKYPNRAWTDEDQAALRRLARQGLSASKIGDLVGRSSNSIIGRCHRTGVQLQGICDRPRSTV